MSIEKRIVDTPEGKVTTFVVDGEELTPTRLEEFLNGLDASRVELDTTKKETLRDYHKKTETLAEERRRLEEEKAGINRERESFSALKDAFDRDKRFYETHPESEWSGYQSEFARLNKAGGSNNSGSGEAVALRGELDQVRAALRELQGKTSALETDTMTGKADATIKFATSLLSTYPFADLETIKNKMYVHFHETNRIPTETEIRSFVKVDHEKKKSLIDRHAPIAVAPDRKEDSIFPSKGTVGTGGNGGATKAVKLSDTGAAIEAGKEFFRKRAAIRK